MHFLISDIQNTLVHAIENERIIIPKQISAFVCLRYRKVLGRRQTINMTLLVYC